MFFRYWTKCWNHNCFAANVRHRKYFNSDDDGGDDDDDDDGDNDGEGDDDDDDVNDDDVNDDDDYSYLRFLTGNHTQQRLT